MSGTHKRKQRDMKREWRSKSLNKLIWLMYNLNIKSARDMWHPNKSNFGRESWEYICKWDKPRS